MFSFTSHIPPAVLGLGAGEWALVGLAVLIIFGIGKIPQIGSGLGKGIKNFRKAVRSDEEDEQAPPNGPPS